MRGQDRSGNAWKLMNEFNKTVLYRFRIVVGSTRSDPQQEISHTSVPTPRPTRVIGTKFGPGKK